MIRADALLRGAGRLDADAVAELLVASRRAFLPYAPSPHSPREVQTWVAGHLIPCADVTVAEQRGRVVAVLATSRTEVHAWIDQLYVLPGHEGRGIGSRLLVHAHEVLPRPIRLYTFQANVGARRFYERFGYKAIAFTDGQSNEERCPDVLYELAAERTLQS